MWCNFEKKERLKKPWEFLSDFLYYKTEIAPEILTIYATLDISLNFFFFSQRLLIYV
jgi:hypothetical protein